MAKATNFVISKGDEDIAFFVHESDARLFAAAPKMLEMLRRLEWSGSESYQWAGGWIDLPICSICEGLHKNEHSEKQGSKGNQVGHYDNCELAALLAAGGTDAK